VKHLVFAYGMNTNFDVMTGYSRSIRFAGTGVLPGWELASRHFFDVQPVPGAQVEGVLWEVTEEGLRMLDAREGYPTFYDRHLVTVTVGYVKKVAYVYSMSIVPLPQLRPPSRTYLDMCTAGYKLYGLPLEQLHRAVEEVTLADAC